MMHALVFQLLGFTQVDESGRAVANIGTVEEDLDGRVVSQMAQNMQVVKPVLRHLLRELSSRHTVDAETVCNEIIVSQAFTPDRYPIIRRGIKACFDGDHEMAAHFLLPQIVLLQSELDKGAFGVKDTMAPFLGIR
ncbi:MAG: hypothetical protein ACP5O7_10625, partial [Phycisphaerae bacterium]